MKKLQGWKLRHIESNTPASITIFSDVTSKGTEIFKVAYRGFWSNWENKSFVVYASRDHAIADVVKSIAAHKKSGWEKDAAELLKRKPIPVYLDEERYAKFVEDVI